MSESLIGQSPEYVAADEKLESRLRIDDQRDLKADQVARNYADGISALKEKHWDVLLLDHDLGDFTGPEGREKTGYDVMTWLEENPEHLPGRVEILTSNPAGRSRIKQVVDRLYAQ